MRDHAANGHDFILRALKTSTELEIDDTGEHVRRMTEVQKPKDQFERSVYAVRVFFSDSVSSENMDSHIWCRRKALERMNRIYNRNWRHFLKSMVR